MKHFLIAIGPTAPKRGLSMKERLQRWRGSELMAGLWLVELDWTADQIRRALVEDATDLILAVFEIARFSDIATYGVDENTLSAVRKVDRPRTGIVHQG